MIIHNYYYEESSRRLYIDFSTKEDGDTFYRTLELPYDEVEYYSPEIINESDLEDIDMDFMINLLDQYLENNDLPEEKML